MREEVLGGYVCREGVCLERVGVWGGYVFREGVCLGKVCV